MYDLTVREEIDKIQSYGDCIYNNANSTYLA